MQGKGAGVTAAAYTGGQQGEGGQSAQKRAFGMSPDSGLVPASCSLCPRVGEAVAEGDTASI